MATVMQLRRELATDFRAVWWKKLVQRMRPELQPTISAKRPETRRCQAAFSAEPVADLRPRLVDRALRNFDLRLKLVLEFRSVVPKRREQATRWPLRRALRKLRAPQLVQLARAFSCPNPRPSIPSSARLANAPCLCSCRSTHNRRAPLRRPHEPVSIFPRAFLLASLRNCRSAARDRSRSGRWRRKEQTKERCRATLRMAPEIERVGYWPLQFTNFKDSTNRGSRTGKSDVRPTMRK